MSQKKTAGKQINPRLPAEEYRKLYEQEKIKNKNLLKSLFYEYKTIVLMTTPDGAIVDANEAAVNFYGYPKNVLVKKNLRDLDIFPAGKVSEALRLAISNRQQYFITRHRLADGSIRDVELYSGMLTVEGEKRLFATVFDITERKQSRRKLKASLEKYRMAFEVSPDVVTMSRVSDGKYLEINARYTEVSGYAKEEVIGKTTIELGIWVQPEDREKFIKELTKTGSLYHYPARFRRKNGEIFHALISAHLIKLDGEDYLFTYTRDVEDNVRTREALEQSELKFRQSFNISPFAIAITNLQTGCYEEVNEVFLEETGYHRDEIIGKTAEELHFWVDYSQRKAFLEEVLKKNYVKDVPVLLRMKNGDKIQALVSSSVIHLNGVPHLLSISRNIQDYQQALHALRKSELRYKTLFNLSPAGIMVIDETGTILEANPSFCRLLSFSPEEIVGKKVWEALYPVAEIQKETVLRDIRKILNSSQAVEKEVINYDKEGLPVYMKLYEKAFELSNTDKAILSISLDITKEKTISEELAHQAERLKEAQQIGRLGSWELMWKNRKLSWSEGLYRILELDTSVKPDYGAFQKRIHPEDVQEARKILKESIRDKKSFKYIHRLLLDNGKIKWVIERGKSFYDDQGNVIRTHGTVQDITRLKETEDQLKNLNEKLEDKVRDRTAKLKRKQQDLSRLLNDMQQVQQELRRSNTALQNLNKELEAFSYSVSHDLKAPVRAIRGFTDILKEDHYDKLNEEGKILLDDIINETYRMTEIIEALLQLSRTGRKTLKYDVFEMEPLVQSVFTEQKKHFQLPHARLKLGAIPPVTADYSLIKQLMSNLLANALKYASKEASPLVEFGFYPHEESGHPVFFVKDNGVGFDASLSEKMFNAFTRLHSRKEFDGTGIGLAIAKRIVSRHGGEIWARGEKGKGATFYFTLPGPKNIEP